MNSRDEAVQLLDHYITRLMERTGTKHVTSDTHAELAQLVDAIIDASITGALQAFKEETAHWPIGSAIQHDTFSKVEKPAAPGRIDQDGGK